MEKSLKKSKLWAIIGAILTALIGLAVFLTFQARSQYSYVSPKRGKMVEAIYGLGKVKSHRKYEVKVGVMTKVRKVHVEEGQEVKKGTPLIQFTDTGVFKAPFDGTVTNVAYNTPETVLPQTTILSMEDLTDKYLEVSIEQEGALRVSVGQPARVLFESLRGEVFQGRVVAIFPKNDEFLTHIAVEGLGKNVLPGMTADVSIIVSTHENALLVPVASLSGGQVLVRRKGEGKLKIPVKVGGIDGQWAEILEGDIRETDEVIYKRIKTED